MKTIEVAAAVFLKDNKIFATQRGYGNYKDWWEFPGGKIEPGETSEEALIREIREELDAAITVDRFLTKVEYDYPEFHLSMECFWCSIKEGQPTLLEHEAARWLSAEELWQVKWLPADITIIEEIENTLNHFEIIRATRTWQQAGAYYVRIQAMAKKHHITLRQEFDDHDTPETKYIVMTKEDFPIATARMYPLDETSVMIGRVVVLPEYRHRGIGTRVVRECEKWAGELGYQTAVLESRDNKIEFYQQMGYEICGEAVDGDTFRCIRMEKRL